MNLIEKSLAIALKAHEGQTDKAGEAYILHPLRIMAKMDSEFARSVALLHDVLEDSAFTSADLLNQSIPSEVVAAVQVLSKVEGENYDQFIARVLLNPLAKKVKIADIEDNINMLRLTQVEDKDLERVAKYHKAWKTLQANH